MDHTNRRVATIVSLIIILLLLIFIAFLFFNNKSQNPSGDTSASGFSPLNSSGGPATDGTITRGTLDLSSPATTSTPIARQGSTQAAQEAADILQQVQQQYRIQAAPSAIVSSGPFMTNVATQPQSSPVSTNTDIPYIPYSYYPVDVPAVRQQASTTAAGGKKPEGNLNQTLINYDKEIYGFASGLGWTQLLGSTGQQVYDMLYTLTSPIGASLNTIGKFIGPAVGGGNGAAGSAAFGGAALGGAAIGGAALAGGGGVQNFGGTLTMVTYCTCSDSVMLDVSDVRGKSVSVLYMPGVSVLYLDYNIFAPGPNVLGNYTSGGGQCMVYSGEECNAEGSPQGTIMGVGSSAE